MQAELRAARQQLLNHAVPGSGSPPTNASLSTEEQEEGSCFSKGQLVAQGSQLGRSYRREKEREGLLHQHGMGLDPLPAHLQGFSSSTKA